MNRLRVLRTLGIATACCAGSILGCKALPAPVSTTSVLPVDDVRASVEVEGLTKSPDCLEIVRIEVWKQERTLKAYCKRGAELRMGVAIGRQEIGAKQRSGDHKTPEGRYRIVADARAGRFHLFIPIDYPSLEDAENALADGRIPRADYDRIVAAHRAGVQPPLDTALGGDLGFHGEGERWRGDSRFLDWTYGCIALTDEEIERLSELVTIGVPVLIHP